MTYSLCITTYNRYDLLLESFAKVIDDERIGEVVIVDDCSTHDIREKLQLLPKLSPKIKVFFQAQNRGMSLNKAHAISFATNEWCIIFDSDNIIYPSYLDAIPDNLEGDSIYCPSFAEPNFDYRAFEDLSFDANNAYILANSKMGECLLNTCNYLVNKDSYLNAYKENKEMKGSDTIWYNYLWLKIGGKLVVVSGMKYFHRTHSDSGFLADCDYNMQQAAKIKKLILEL